MARLSIGSRPRICGAQGFNTLGFRHPGCYTPAERRMILDAPVVYYPTSFYAGLLASIGKPTFPGLATYHLVGDKLRQSAMFQLLGVPHPRTWIYPRRRWGDITRDFPFPFVAKLQNTSRGRGVFLIQNEADLAAHLTALLESGAGCAYVQEYMRLERDLRVVCYNRRPVHAYWRERTGEDFRANVSLGARVNPCGVPPEALRLAVEVAEMCGLDEVGLDLCDWQGFFLVIEANMAFGTRGLEAAGKDLKEIIKNILESDEIENRLLTGGKRPCSAASAGAR
ncbi:MAG: RimK family alpha-L-glutamate ligase [Pseudomonadota bacterium]